MFEPSRSLPGHLQPALQRRNAEHAAPGRSTLTQELDPGPAATAAAAQPSVQLRGASGERPDARAEDGSQAGPEAAGELIWEDVEVEGEESRTGSSAPHTAPTGGGRRLQMLFGVQRMAAAAPAEDPAHVHASAARGTATPSTRLPHLDQIQRAFGGHDVSQIQAHVGPEAAASARGMGARAYATGDHVVLSPGADLHTVAHEAAHVVQQRAGVHLKGGVGQVGDAHEQHADAVADRVVAGQSASDLLDQYARPGGGASAGSIQMKAASTLPDPLPDKVATVGYYVARNNDFKKRHPSPPPNPPSYYIGYGNKYAHRFTEVLAPKLSKKGHAWVWQALTALQLAMENKLVADRAAFDRLERDDNDFTKFAYGTHPKAYLDAGLHTLPLSDLVKIFKTPDLGDLLTIEGVKQVFKTAIGLVPQWAKDAEHKAAKWLKKHWPF